ncbi:hypothetical protein GGR51DRAFT_559483 [Nemania sp. FL0031]|nr:hypothetical protein GGR51DRAFT_559483 [Nemania sp. FL0031]
MGFCLKTQPGGLAAILSKSRSLMCALANQGHVDMRRISADLKGAYHTTIIHSPKNPLFPDFQIRKVDEDERFVDYDSLLEGIDEPDASEPDPTWDGAEWRPSSLLLALFVLLNLYLGSCDFEIRSLARFVALKSELSSLNGLLTSFVDQIGITTLLTARKVGCSVVVGSKSIVLLGALMPIFTPNLFFTETVQLRNHVTFQQDEWIASSNSGYYTSNLAAGAILASNLPYSPWMFEDLVFPSVSLANGSTLVGDPVVTTDIRAVRAVLKCRASIGTSNFEFGLNGRQYTCLGSKTPVCGTSYGQSFGTTLNDLPLTCSDDTGGSEISSFPGMPITAYTWGSCTEFGPFQPTNYTAVLICDESFEQVEVTTTLFGPSLEMRDSHPPAPKGATAEPYMLQVNDTSYYQFASGATVNRSGDLGFFPALTTGRYGVPEAWFRDDSYRQGVIAAIKRQHGILRAQGINGGLGARRRFDNDAKNLTPVEMSAPKRPPNVEGEYQYVLQRVVQHFMPTFTLLGLLITVLLLHIFTTFQSEREGYRRAVPKPPGSIAAVTGLFANSDIPQNLPVDAQWMTERKFKAHFQGRRFRMGWLEQHNGISRKKVYTIQEVRDVNTDA